MTDFARWLDPVLTVARRAGEAILEVYATDFGVDHKDDRTPVTRADLAAHRVIVDGLARLEPRWPVLSEESREIPFSRRRDWERYWLVDPLDGTREFIKRNGEFTVNIALIDGHRPVLGVVQVPVSGAAYLAAAGSGAFRELVPGRREPIRCRRLGTGPVTVAGSRSHAGERLQAYLQRLGEHELVSMGSSLKFCLVASGEADVYVRLGKTSEWDTAAAQCVVEEAGGAVTDTARRPLRYNTKDSLLNPEFMVFGDESRDWAGYLPGD